MNRAARWNQQNITNHIFVVLALAGAIPCWAQNPVPTSVGQRDRVVLVSLVDRKLAVIDNGVVIATFQVAVGAKASPSPTGEFTIVSRVSNPGYYHRGTVIPTGKDNPVGTRWVGLSLKGYGIHGTNAPRSIGRAGLAWVHPAAQSRHGTLVHHAADRRCGRDSGRARPADRTSIWRADRRRCAGWRTKQPTKCATGNSRERGWTRKLISNEISG